MGQWECMAGCEYEYFQFKETPESIEQKKWTGLKPLTPGSESGRRCARQGRGLIASLLFLSLTSAWLQYVAPELEQRLLLGFVRQG